MSRVLPPHPGDSSSLSRGLQILDVVQAHGGASVAEVAGAVGLPLSTSYRLVRQLREAGFVVEVDGRILPSAKLSEPGSPGDSQHLVRYASRLLVQLRDLTKKTVILTVRVRTAALCLDLARAHSMHQLAFRRGQVRALYAGASVTPLLAFAPRVIVEETLQGPMKKFTGATPATAKDIRAEIATIRKNGYAFSEGSLNPSMAAVGVPVLVDGQCLCALSLVGTTADFREFSTDLDALQRAARHLERLLPQDAASAWHNDDEPELELQ